MFFTNFRRIVRTGFINFWRNSFVTAASILVMTTTLFVLGTFIFVDALLGQTLEQIRSRVDINVYFNPAAEEADILAIRDNLEELVVVADVEYVSRDQVLEDFENRYQGDDLIIGALDELDDNPLGAVLNVQAPDPSQYSEINDYLESEAVLTEAGEDIIQYVNFNRNREAIDKLSNLINTIDFLSIAILIFFGIISVLITFNTIRLAIYNSRDEISVMKLVGASNTYIRGPFVIEGIMYGVVSAIIALILLYPLALWVGPEAETFFGASNLFDYYIDNFGQFFTILLLSGLVLGAISSFAAVKKYLRIYK